MFFNVNVMFSGVRNGYYNLHSDLSNHNLFPRWLINIFCPPLPTKKKKKKQVKNVILGHKM